jgi:hypothetical protein
MGMPDRVTEVGSATATDPAMDAWQKVLQEVQNYEAIMDQDKKQLASAIKAMLDALKKGTTDGKEEAMQIALTKIMPEVMVNEGDKAAVQAAQMDVGTGLRGFQTDIQNTFNDLATWAKDGGEKTDPAKGKALTEKLQKLVNDFDGAVKNAPPGLLDSNGTDTTLISGIDAIKDAFGSHWGNTDAMQKDFNSWFTQDYKGPAPAVTQIQNAFQQINATCSSVNQIAQTKMQFLSTGYNQEMGGMQQIFNGLKTAISTMINGQKAG